MLSRRLTCLFFSISSFNEFFQCFTVFIIYTFFFFFKQKTEYELRISDWISDVCSSDLAAYAWLTASGTQTLVNRGFRTAQTRCDSLDGMPGDQQTQNFHFPVGEACGQARYRFIGKHVFRSPQPHEQVHPNLSGKRQQDQTEHGEKRALKHRRRHDPEGDDSNNPTLIRRAGPHPQMTTAFRVYGYPFAKSFIAIDVSASVAVEITAGASGAQKGEWRLGSVRPSVFAASDRK